MNKIKYLVLGALVLSALLCMPVMAFTQDVTIQSNVGGINPTFSMSIEAGTQTMPLVVGENLKDGPAVTVASNTPYSIKAKDNMAGTKPPGTGGKMFAIDPGTGGVQGAVLTNAIQTALNGGTFYPMTETDTTIRSGTPESFTGPLKLKQVIVVTDPIIPAPYVYQITLTVTGSATP